MSYLLGIKAVAEGFLNEAFYCDLHELLRDNLVLLEGGDRRLDL